MEIIRIDEIFFMILEASLPNMSRIGNLHYHPYRNESCDTSQIPKVNIAISCLL